MPEATPTDRLVAARAAGHQLSDGGAMALAGAVWLGAAVATPVPLLLVGAVVAIAYLLRRPVVLMVGAGLLAAALGARAEAGLVSPSPARIDGEVTLLSDPTGVRGGLRLDVRVGRRRVEAWARGAAASALRPRLAGEVVDLEGRLGSVPEGSRRYLNGQHVSARLAVTAIGGWRPGSPISRLANGLRRTLDGGAAPLGQEHRALFLGMTIGDDRDQPVEVADDFRGAGLTHLLAVSGQNVAFVLMLARPFLSRLGLRGRWAATLALLAFFALLTRFEPSVLRAVAMAAIAATAAGLGRPAARLRILALAVAGLVLVDPLLVRSVGFQLSVGATAGIALLAEPLASRLRGPRWLTGPLAVTVAAQAGVAPVLVPVFGGVPVASFPANLLAVPAAAPVMAWGLTGGMAAGLLGPPFDALLHLPTRLLVGWVAAVARASASLGLGLLEGGHLVALVAVAGTAVAAARWSRAAALWCGVLCAWLVVLTPALRPASGPLDGEVVTEGAALWRRDSTLLVLDGAAPAPLLEQLRRAGVHRIDAVVSRRGNRTAASNVALLRSRLDVGVVLAPEGHAIRDAFVPPSRAELVVGQLSLTAERTFPTLEVAVAARGP